MLANNKIFLGQIDRLGQTKTKKIVLKIEEQKQIIV